MSVYVYSNFSHTHSAGQAQERSQTTREAGKALQGEVETLMKGMAEQRASNLRTIKENKSLLLELKCVCMCVCLRACICLCVFMYVCVHVHVFIVRVHVFERMCVCM